MQPPKKSSSIGSSPQTRRGIQSVEVGGLLLQALMQARRPMMLKDLAAAAGMASGKAHPYLVSFISLGLVEQDLLSGQYRLGTFALQLGLAALASLDPVKAALGVIPVLAESIGHSVVLAVWGNMGPTVIHVEEAGPQLHLNLRAGTVMQPLSGSAIGRCFAAYLAPKQLLGMADDIAESQLLVIREQGLARAQGHPIPGINALAAPVYNHQGHMVLAIAAIGSAQSCSAQWNNSTAQHLAKCASTLSQRLGFYEVDKAGALGDAV